MSCKKQILGAINGLPDILSFLEGSTSHATNAATVADNAWPDPDPASWEWSDDTSPDHVDDPEVAPPAATAGAAAAATSKEPEWLDACRVAMSPLGDVLTLATDEKVVILTAQWDTETSHSRFSVSAQLTAPDDVTVTSLLCLPMASPHRSSAGAADWTCVMVGQQSGHVVFYTEDGCLLLRQRLHETSVCSLSCCSRQVTSAGEEEVTVVFEDAVVMLDGFALFQTLRACRSRLARLRAGGAASELDVGAPPLAQQKWELRYQQRTETAENVGFCSTSLFDHLAEESLIKPGASVTSASVPAGSLLVTTGRCPFVGFFHASEGTEQARLDQVVRGVASKVKDTVFSTIGNIWTGGGAQKAAKPEPEIETGAPIKCRFGLPDVQRHGQLMALSRDRRMSAVADSFGRVTLIDNHGGIALAMWKGYRDAECGWLEVREPRGPDGHRSGRRAHFLVLYAPRRGVLEVWTPGGSKVAAFSVSKHGRLMNISHGITGQSEADPGRRASRLVQCMFLAPDGRLTMLDVPFHMALSEHSSRRAHAHHLLREVRTLLRMPPPDVASVLRSQLLQMRTAGARLQAMEAVLGCRRLKLEEMEAVVDAVLELCGAQEPSALDPETQQLLQTALGYKRLLAAYTTLQALAEDDAEQEDDNVTAQTLMSSLSLSSQSATDLLSRLNPSTPSETGARCRPRVSFADEGKTPGVAAFLRCFQVKPGPQRVAVSIKEKLAEDEVKMLGDMIFGPCLSRSTIPPSWERAVLRSGPPAGQLLRLLTSCWLQLPPPARPRQLISLAALLHKLGQMEGSTDLPWQVVQDLVSESRQVQRALLLATVCRGVAAKLEESSSPMMKPALVERPAHASPESQIQTSSEAPRHSEHDRPPSPTSEDTTTSHQTSSPQDSTKTADNPPLKHDSSAEPSCDKPEETPMEVDEVGREADDWERMTAQTVVWDLLLDQLTDVVALWDILPEAALSDVSLHSLLKKGPGAVSELVARWLLTEGALPEDMAASPVASASASAGEAPPEDAEEARRRPQTRKEEDTEMAEEAEGDEHKSRFHAALCRLAAHFPHSVSGDALLLNSCWEEAAAWSLRREHTSRLAAAVQFAARIHSAHLRYGACCLLWAGVVRQPCGAAAGLLQRSGRCPDDASCRREVQLPALQLPQLLDCCRQLLQIVVMTMVDCESEPAPSLYNDNLWATQGGGRHGPASLLDMAARQRRCAEDLAALHLQMVDVMRAQVHLGMKNVYPYHCFNQRDRDYLFADLTAQYRDPSSVDQAVRVKREALLCRWTSAAVRHIYTCPDGTANASETSLWISRCEQLAQVWDIPPEVVRRQYTLDLYNSGHDQLASQVLSTVSRPSEVASQLLLLAGARVRHYIHANNNMVQLLARLSMRVADFLKVADIPLQCASVGLDRTLLLLRHVARLEPDTPSERRVTLELIALVEGLTKAEQAAIAQR